MCDTEANTTPCQGWALLLCFPAEKGATKENLVEAAARPAQELTPDCSTAGDCPGRLQREALGPMESHFQNPLCGGRKVKEQHFLI